VNQSQTAKRRHELWQDLASCVADMSKEFELPAEKAEQLGWYIANAMAEHWGGQQISFPKDVKFHLTQRDQDIYQKFNGRNHWELAKEYGVTTRAIYRIIDRARKIYVDERQPKLFD